MIVGLSAPDSLLSKYGTLDNLYEHIDEVSGKTKEKLLNDKENAYMSQDIATIYTDVPINTNLENIHYHGINALEYVNLLEELLGILLLFRLESPQSNFHLEVLHLGYFTIPQP